MPTFKERYGKRAKAVSSRGTGFLQGLARHRRRQLTGARGIAMPLVGGVRRKGFGGRGRPKGSYDPRYAAYGGVYEYRKRLNAQLRVQKALALRNAAVTPQQQQVLADIAARDRARQLDPENQTIADTRGTVRLRTIHDEIDEAARLVP